MTSTITIVVTMLVIGMSGAAHAASPEPYAPSHWVSVHGDSHNSDYVALSPSAKVQPYWAALEGAAIFVGPIFDTADRLYVPTGRGVGTSHLHAYSADGTLLWETSPMQSLDDVDYGAVISAPIIDSDNNVYANDLNQLWSFTPQGKLRWVTDLKQLGIDGLFITPVFHPDGWVGGVSTDGKVAFFYRDSGELAVPVFTLPVSQGKPSAPLPPGIWQGGLIAEAFHQQLWDILYGRNMAVTNTPAIHNRSGRLFITSAAENPDDGVLFGIDIVGGKIDIAFATPMGGGSGTSPAISPDGKLVYAIDDNGMMIAVDTESGAVKWSASDTMGQASPSIGPDGTVYSFNGEQGTIVAIDGKTGAIKWRRDYHQVAVDQLRWHLLFDRVATVDGLITVTDSGLWTFLDLCYQVDLGATPFPQPRKVVVAQIDPATGEVLATFDSRDASGAFVVPDAKGNQYLTLSATATSIFHYGVDPQLPFFLRSGFEPVGGIQVFRPATK